MLIDENLSLIKLGLKQAGLFILCFYSCLSGLESYEGIPATPCEPRILDFDTAVQRTLNQSLVLSQAQENIQGKRGLITQARLYPNPEFAYSLETSELGWQFRQEIYTLNQLVELGGKRQKLIKVASYEYYAALTGYEISKLERLSRLSKAFIRVFAAQELAKLAIDHQRNAQEGTRLIKAKVEAGKASLIQQHKTEVAQLMADINFRKALAEFQAAKNSLALLWSSSCPDFDGVTYPLFDISAPIPLEEYLAKLCEQPEVVQSLYKYMAAYHTLRFEKAVRIPDVIVTLGYSYNAGSNDFVAGLSVPLPIWNRNQGNIKRAYSDMLKIGDEGQQLWLFLETKLSNAYLELTRIYQEAEEYKNVALRFSREALELAREGYREGKLEYWEVLDTQNAFFDLREKYIQALVLYHNKQAEINYLTSQTD